MSQVGFQELGRGGSISHDALGSVLGVLCLHADLSMGEVKIADLQAHQLLTAQRSIVCDQQPHLLIRFQECVQRPGSPIPLRKGRAALKGSL